MHSRAFAWTFMAVSLVGTLLPSSITAHSSSESMSIWETRGQDKGVYSTLVISRREASRLKRPASIAAEQILLQYSKHKFKLSDHNGVTCPPGEHRVLPSSGDFYRIERVYNCIDNSVDIGNGSYTLHIDFLFNEAPFHTHFVRLNTTEGRQEIVFKSNLRQHEFSFTKKIETTRSYGLIGFEHIITGIDHLVFLGLILLLAGSLRTALWPVTGFTIGHSLSLALASADIVRPDGVQIEAGIGLTIMLAAFDFQIRREASNNSLLAHNTSRYSKIVGISLCLLAFVSWLHPGYSEFSPLTLLGMGIFAYCYLQLSFHQPNNHRIFLTMTTVFGFIHGFGFAGFLLEVGLPTTDFAYSLFMFNVGIELGQISIAAGMMLLIGSLRKVFPNMAWSNLAVLLAALLGACGSYWFFSRGF